MKRVPVSSSNLASVGYDPKSQTLEIAFHNGSVYRYVGVPAALYEGLLAAASHGRYFHAYIKDRYPYQRV